MYKRLNTEIDSNCIKGSFDSQFENNMNEIRNRIKNRKGIYNSEIILGIFIILFVLQTVLDDYIRAFSYLDEIVAFIGFIGCICRILKNNGRVGKDYIVMFMFLTIYVLVSLTGNYIYQYQNSESVIKDMITNIKFYLSLTFASVFMTKDPQSYTKIPKLAKSLTVFLFLLFILDNILDIFPHGYEYFSGIRCTQLFFEHTTYLAGCGVFLVALLAYYGVKNNLLYITLDLIMIFMTLRSKAMAGVLVFVALYFVIIVLKTRINPLHIFVLGIFAVAVAWKKIQFYFIKLSGASARSVMLTTAFKIMKDFFPIGTGFGTYGSHEAGANYSPIYILYGFLDVPELSGRGHYTFLDDQFWPIVFGQSGVIGTICYLAILIILFTKIQKMRKVSVDIYLSGLFIFIYLLISSTSEPAYNNSIAIPMGLVLGMGLLRCNDKQGIVYKENVI